MMMMLTSDDSVLSLFIGSHQQRLPDLLSLIFCLSPLLLHCTTQQDHLKMQTGKKRGVVVAQWSSGSS